MVSNGALAGPTGLVGLTGREAALECAELVITTCAQAHPARNPPAGPDRCLGEPLLSRL